MVLAKHAVAHGHYARAAKLLQQSDDMHKGLLLLQIEVKYSMIFYV